jgi:hypothetical protein
MKTLNELYTVSEDWTGSKYCGLTLEWDYTNCTIDISILVYIKRALQCFNHPAPTHQQHAPHAWQKPTYCTMTQYAPAPNTSLALNAKDTKHVQEVLGTLLYYAHAVDSRRVPDLGGSICDISFIGAYVREHASFISSNI